MKFNRWFYIALVAFLSFVVGFASEYSLIAGLGVGVFLTVLTYPLGTVGSFCVFALVYFGFATPSEAGFIVAPLYAVLGWLQWYVILPRWLAKRSKAIAN